MKAFVAVSALAVAAVKAEADPSVLLGGAYGSYGAAGLGLNGYGASIIGAAIAPIAYGKSAPCVNAYNKPVPCAAGTYGSAYGLPIAAHKVWKREAEAEADPSYLNNGAYGLAGLGINGAYGLAGLGYNGALGLGGLGYAGAYGAPLATTYGGAYGLPIAAHKVWKREAEAEADPSYLNNGAYGLAGLGVNGAYGLTGLGYNGALGLGGLGYAGAYGAPLATSYGGAYGLPIAAHKVWKREAEAEAEADPSYLNNGAYGLAGLGINGAYGLGGLGYAGAYGIAPVTTVVKPYGVPHAVAATPYGLTHSSNVGVCTNNAGVAVAC